MGIKRKQLATITRTIRVEYYDDILTVTYKPDELSPFKLEEIGRERKEEQDAAERDNVYIAIGSGRDLAILLSRAMVHWDMIEEDESMSPLTTENLLTYSAALLVAIRDAINEDMGPKAKRRQR